jgi:hypothetical protein
MKKHYLKRKEKMTSEKARTGREKKNETAAYSEIQK